MGFGAVACAQSAVGEAPVIETLRPETATAVVSAGDPDVGRSTGVERTPAVGDTQAGDPERVMASCAPVGEVHDVVHAHGAYYLAGEFTVVRDGGSSGEETPTGTTRRGLAACDAVTGALLGWSPDGGVDGVVSSLDADDRWLYVGGEFTRVGGHDRTNLARLSLDTGEVDGHWGPSPDRPVKRVVVADDGFVYVGGRFARIGDVRRPALARLYRTGIVDTTFAPDIGLDDKDRPWVGGVALSEDGSTVVVGGQFDTVGGQPRSGLAAVDRDTGRTVTPFAPALADSNPRDPQVQVEQVLIDGGRVYACGDWWVTEGRGSQEAQRNVGRFDAVTGAADLGWLPSTDGGIEDCAMGPRGGALVIGGHFDVVNGEYRPKIAALSLDEPVALPFPTANTPKGVAAVEVAPQRVAVVGAFTEVRTQDGPVEQPGLAMILTD